MDKLYENEVNNGNNFPLCQRSDINILDGYGQNGQTKTAEELYPVGPDRIPDEDDENSMYCDGPGSRTRSKVGHGHSKSTSSQYIIQIPLHMHKKGESKKCVICGKLARSPSDLQRHMRVHTGERPFPCCMCKKSFKCKRSQLTHQFLSHGIKDGLSEARLNLLQSRKMKNSLEKLKPLSPPNVNDQDEDTEIIEGQQESSGSELPMNFTGLFSRQNDNESHIQSTESLLSSSSNNECQSSVIQSIKSISYQRNMEGELPEVVNVPLDIDSLSLPVLTKEEPLDKTLENQDKNNKIDHIPNNITEIRDNLKNKEGNSLLVNSYFNGLEVSNKEFNKNEKINTNSETTEIAHGLSSKKVSSEPNLGNNDIAIHNLNSQLITQHLSYSEILQQNTLSDNLEAEVKLHECVRCKRQFRSIYTLRYHLRSMHGEMVYLSPALESRLKKRRWTPPYVRLQKSKDTNDEQRYNTRVIVSNLGKEQETVIDFSSSANLCSEQSNINIDSKEPLSTSINICQKIKEEQIDSAEDENNNHEKLLSNYKNNNPLHDIFNAHEQHITKMPTTTTTTVTSTTTTVPNQNEPPANSALNGSSTTKSSVPDPFVLPPQIFLPSTSETNEGLENGSPISWDSIRVTSENALLTKLEAIHSATQQKYILYKCCLCGKAFSGLRIICTHLALHNDSDKENDCEKCGASFKWKHELDLHLEYHRTTERKYVSASPFLPSYYVNPFPIPVVASSEQVMSATGLLSYPFFPMPQQISPMMQPGFFPFFAATLPTPSQLQADSETNIKKTNHSPPEGNRPENFDEKNVAQNCSFQCKMCPKSFDRIFSLQRHERIHSGVKACFCKICGKGFSELRNLRHHIVRFHADTAQKEPLPYRRKPSRLKNVSSSQRLVSFLKKTAVRILNSMGQHRLDPPASSVKIQTDDLLSNNRNYTDTDVMPENLTTNINQNHVQGNKNEEPQNIKVQDETDEHHSQISVKNSISIVNMASKSAGNDNSIPPKNSQSTKTMEVLQDPKRSLMGNRRKGRPFKLSSTSYHPLNSLLDENLFLDPTIVANGSTINGLGIPMVSSSTILQVAQTLGGHAMSKASISQPTYLETEPEVNEPLDMRSLKGTNPVATVKSEPGKTEDVYNHNMFSINNSNQNTKLKVQEKTTFQLTQNQNQGENEGKCLFPCSYCYKSFNSLSDLNRHMSFHADIRPFKCPYCSYCSRTNSQLKVHMMRHEGIKHYMCHVCNYNGVTQSDLNRHLKTRTHLLRSRNICSCCGTGFHTRSLSDEHYKSCHLSSQSNSRQEKPTESHNRCPPVSKSRLSRLQCIKNPEEERIKNELYQKIFDLGKMGMTFGNFLQQNTSSGLVK